MITNEKIALDVESAARAISVSPWTIRKWISEGKLASIKIGRRVLVTPDALRKLAEEGTRPAAAEADRAAKR